MSSAVGGAENRLAVFAVMAVLSVAATINVLPFSKIWNRDMAMLEKRRSSASQ